MDAQLKRGILDICVLAALLSEDSYGYKIIKDLTGFVELSESTLYPVLKRLEASAAVTSYTSEHGGRLRRYYKITDAGRHKIREFLEEWREMMRVYEFINGRRERI
jgi:PadR family transcriptional regulator PadR